MYVHYFYDEFFDKFGIFKYNYDNFPITSPSECVWIIPYEGNPAYDD